MSEAVLFDMDGTLIDSHSTHVDCWLRYAAGEGVRLDRDRVNSTFGMVNREIVRTFWPGEVSDKKIMEISEGKEAMVRTTFRENFPAMPGAAELVRTLYSHGFKLAVGSSGPRENVELACQLLGIVPFLGAMISSSDVSRGKPHPEIFLTAAQRLGISPNRCLVVEDAAVGIEAAHFAGMKCAALLSTGHTESELRNADRIIRSLDELTPTVVCEMLDR